MQRTHTDVPIFSQVLLDLKPSWCLKKAQKHFEPMFFICCCQDVDLHFWRDTAYLDATNKIRIKYLIVVSSFQIVKHPRQQFAAVGCCGESGHDDLGETNKFLTTRRFIIHCIYCFFFLLSFINSCLKSFN